MQPKQVNEQRHNSFLHGLDNTHINRNSFPPMDERELQARVNHLSRRMKTSAFFAGFCIIMVVVSVLFADYLTLMFGDLAQPFVMVGGGALSACLIAITSHHKKRLKSLVSNNIVRGVLSDTFDLTHYAPGCHIGQSTITESALIQRNWNTLSGSDLVEGSYKGVRFRFSDIHLEMVTRSKNGKRHVTVFKGQWLIIELSKVLPWSLQLRSRTAVGKRIKSDIETENIEFNKKFQIKCGDPHTAFYILTPHFMEYIMSAKNKANRQSQLRTNAQTHMNFSGQSVQIALHNGRDLFEPCSRRLFAKDNIAALRKQMQWDADYITGIIDELLLNENLFKKEN